MKARLPEWPTFVHYVKLALLLDILFVLVYGTSAWLSAQRTDVHALYFSWEREIVLWPAMLWVYASILPLMILPVFYLQVSTLNRLAWRMAAAVVVAGLVFLIYPARLGYPTAQAVPLAFDYLYWLDSPYNVFPSLHIALSALVVFSLLPAMGGVERVLLGAWLVAISASVLLVHQHHLLDVVGGIALAWFSQWAVPAAPGAQ